MYFPYFLTYIGVGFAVSLVAFLWALHTGQFRDQQRARYLPLEPESGPRQPPPAGFPRVEVYGLFFLACTGLLATAAVVGFSLLRG